MALHLLTLPGEIRNKIYEFAITESEGVNYREDERDVGWLCLYERDPENDSYEWEHDGKWKDVEKQRGKAVEAIAQEEGEPHFEENDLPYQAEY